MPLHVVAFALGHRDGEWKNGLESSPDVFLPYPEIPEEAKGRSVENGEEGCMSVCDEPGPHQAQYSGFAEVAIYIQRHVTGFTCACKRIPIFLCTDSWISPNCVSHHSVALQRNKKPAWEKEVKPKVGHKRRLEKIPLFALSSKELSHVVIFS